MSKTCIKRVSYENEAPGICSRKEYGQGFFYVVLFSEETSLFNTFYGIYRQSPIFSLVTKTHF